MKKKEKGDIKINGTKLLEDMGKETRISKSSLFFRFISLLFYKLCRLLRMNMLRVFRFKCIGMNVLKI